MANSPISGPIYFGARSANSEKETFGYLLKTQSVQPLAFMGPARNFGLATGDAEKDTIAYRPLLGGHSAEIGRSIGKDDVLVTRNVVP